MRTQGIIGAAIMAIGGMCPLVRVPILGNWNYFDLDQTLAITFYVMVLMGLIGAFTTKAGLVKFAGWAGILLVAITLAGVYFKAHDSFGFLHFKKAVNFAAGLVKYKWGWFVILAGTFILITVRKPKAVIIAQGDMIA
ncbi:hypothetical protein [Pedobacter heparinus]|uniref:Uncharacterized protein n=1 Tax=Pedobacter heparinus (strain ATCC 13125 / DSM 2366 / CIP 104194 / JCM 7457 / NBRC 12017 / NCIMB 9290 / NRRL B-14731 / HIM 762-3) TaxID=485917 RepID=C6Y3X7_PEDHD|nr:hypothetical protein [Pedobacter heparinus]ACU05420.1 hypothetical protein Phep_3225 [Pedobacter heparinus DSM 2366]